MRRLAILTFQTLDGVMQAPSVPEEDPSGGFTQGGWANAHWNDVMAQVERHAMKEPYDLLLGRNTYDNFAQHFSGAAPDNRIAQKLNKAKKYVVTTRSDTLAWQHSEKISGDIVAAVSALKTATGPLLQVHGSWQLVQLLLLNRLVDELRLWTFPVVVGAGKRLFSDGAVPATFKLTQFDVCPSGAFMHFYLPVKDGTL